MELLNAANIEIVEFSPGKSLTGVKAMWQMFRLSRHLKRGGYKIFHAHDVYSNLLGVPAARFAGVPLVLASRRDLGDWWWYTRRNRWVLNHVLRWAHIVVANSSFVAKTLVRDGIGSARIRVVRNAVDATVMPVTESLRKQIGVSSSRKLVVTVANMQAEAKGHTYLLEAARAVIAPKLVEPGTNVLFGLLKFG